LRQLPPGVKDPNLLVGHDTLDDAAVYRLGPDSALVQTVDFFTPVVDDPYDFGRIAAANALSDVYAMGARPFMALNIVGFPTSRLGSDILAEILRGGADILGEAGVVLAGGHSIDDPEPKYGLAVTGLVHPERVVANAGARPGNLLYLTKPIGIGIITTAIKRDLAGEDVIRRATAIMAELNRGAAEAMLEVGVDACTDVTGFGLAGHASEMARASRADLMLSFPRLPVLTETWEFVRREAVPGGTKNNLKYLTDPANGPAGGPLVDFDPGLDGEVRLVVCDAVTSGGLLISVPPERAAALEAAFAAKGVKGAARIGEVVPGPGRVRVLPGTPA
jgi:selenide,water dikinase